jgi:melibiose permease/lactose/raffinose/galactose permease
LIVTIVLTVLRIFDAVNDPITGLIVDRTKSKFGKFKPWMLVGMLLAGIIGILLFTDINSLFEDNLVGNVFFTLLFTALFLLWDLFFGLNDTAYWGMLPSLSLDNKEREKTGSFARICACIGAFAVAVAVVPLANILSDLFDHDNYLVNVEKGLLDKTISPYTPVGWLILMVIMVIFMFGFQLFTLLGVKEKKDFKENDSFGFKDMLKAIGKNDQLLAIGISMLLFMTGYMAIVGFGLYYCKYVLENEGFYTIFAIVLGVSQLTALTIYPFIAKKLKRKSVFTLGAALMSAGCVLFFFADSVILLIILSGILLFIGEGFIQVLMLVFIQDTVEYGQLKTGKRSDAVTFSVQSFINKGSGALGSTLIVGLFLMFAGISDESDSVVHVLSDNQKMIFKVGMFVIPLILFVTSYFLYRALFKIDEKYHDEIVQQLKDRGDILEDTPSDNN